MSEDHAHHDIDNTPRNVVELVINIDDTTPELLASLQDKLMTQGALDVWTTPINMKAGRPAVMLSVLAAPEDQDQLAETILRESGAFGLRHRAWDRTTLERSFTQLDSPLGPFTAKVGHLHGKPIAAKPEWRDIYQLAQQHNLPLTAVQNELAAIVHQHLKQLQDRAEGRTS
ncbi:nickel insertion protein [Poriferisphaera sp. WC338]|uniref:nickel insertion protein n=1 Tax=Poriferisphaera sp. WC338 TaxID=3425129 RepID=UPI003D81AE21